MLTILIVLLVLSALFGGWGAVTNGGFSYAGWSPLGIVLAIIVVLALTGNLHGFRFR